MEFVAFLYSDDTDARSGEPDTVLVDCSLMEVVI